MIEPAKLSEPMTVVSMIVNVTSNVNGSFALMRLSSSPAATRAAARAVEERDHLRHRGHLHDAPGIDADDRAHDDAQRDDPPLDDALCEYRDNRDEHADGRDPVT